MNKEKLLGITKMTREMRLPEMDEQLFLSMETGELSSEEPLITIENIIRSEYISRKNNIVIRMKKSAKLLQPSARLENLDYKPTRNLDKAVIDQLTTNDYIQRMRNVVILGACGTGKSYLANALGNNA
ncbi:hypothetical protein AOC36_08695 [Erysipelothrix larvae]|uniref:IstB-like ATP-binding domain-containing protein n=1 Tax=Erysipelothrix larvae TaxID=1514105 RepID=A0A109UHD3_9FIRM|nr:hypothetical protein AOC36_08695 [Erysipelothrix larvae]